MALDPTDPAKVVEETLAAQKIRDLKLIELDSQVASFAGPWHSGSSDDTKIENAAFELISSLIPQMTEGDAKDLVTTRRGRAQGMVALACQLALERWTRDSEASETWLDLAYDSVFRWGICHVAPVPAPGVYEFDDPRLWPQAARVSPYDWGMDARASNHRRARLTFRKWTIDKDDLLAIAAADLELPASERQGWDYEVIDGLPTFPGEVNPLVHVAEGGKKRRKKAAWEAPDRKQVTLYEVWFPGVRLSGEPGAADGFNGTIGVYAPGMGARGIATGASSVVMKPHAFFGPRWGADILFGTYTVPEDPYPLSILCAAGEHIERCNRVASAVDRAIQNYKRVLFVSGEQQELAEKIRSSPHDYVQVLKSITNLGDRIASLEFGGVTPQMVEAYQLLKDQMNQVLGLGEVQRGNAPGIASATEVGLAVQASQSRVGHVIHRYRKQAQRVKNTVLWYLYHTDEIVFPIGELGPEEAAALGLEEGEELWFQGGSLVEGSGYTFDDLGLESRWLTSDESQRRVAFLQNVALAIAPALPTLLKVGGNVEAFLDEIGEAEGFPRFSSWWDMKALAAAAESQELPERAEPMFLRDTGLKGLGIHLPGSASTNGSAKGIGGPRKPGRSGATVARERSLASSRSSGGTAPRKNEL